MFFSTMTPNASQSFCFGVRQQPVRDAVLLLELLMRRDAVSAHADDLGALLAERGDRIAELSRFARAARACRPSG